MDLIKQLVGQVWAGASVHDGQKAGAHHTPGTVQPNQPLQGLSLLLFSILTKKKYDFLPRLRTSHADFSKIYLVLFRYF